VTFSASFSCLLCINLFEHSLWVNYQNIALEIVFLLFMKIEDIGYCIVCFLKEVIAI